MRRRVRVSAIDLMLGRGFVAVWSHKSGILSPPFSLISSNFLSDRAFSPKPPIIDLSCVDELNNVVHLFHEWMRMLSQPSVRVYNNLLSATVKMKQYAFALYMFDEMRRMGITVNKSTLSIAINCYCLLKRADFGFAIIGIFVKSGYEPNVATFGTLIKALILDDKIVSALKLFNKLVDFRICEPNDVLILTMVGGLCETGDVSTACYLLRRLRRTRWRPNVEGYNALIDGLSSKHVDVFELLSDEVGKSTSPDVFSFNSMIKGLSKVSRLKDIEGLLNKMANSNIPIDVVTFSILIDALCKKGKVKEAENVLEIMIHQNIHPSVATYNALINGFCLRGEINKAKQILDSIVEKGLKPNIISYGSLMNGYCKQGRVDEAWLLFLEVPCTGLENDICTYTTMIHGLCKNGKHGVARDLFNQLPSKGLQRNARIYTMIIDSLCQEGSVEEAKRLLVEMENRHCAPNSVTYNVIVRGLLKKNELDEAIPFLELMHQRRFSADSVTLSMLLDQVQGQSEDDFLLKLIKNVSKQILLLSKSYSHKCRDRVKMIFFSK